MCACVSIIKNSIPAENDETLVESQNFMELSSKKKKAYGRETETDKKKRKTFQGTEGIVEYFLDSTI